MNRFNFCAILTKFRIGARKTGPGGGNRHSMQVIATPRQAEGNVRLYPWFRAFQNLVFWQAVWFLFFQSELSAAEAILLYVLYDVATTVLEVPSGYMSDRWGRRPTLVVAALAGMAGCLAIVFGDGFVAFAVGQVLLGASSSFVSGTDSAMLYESLKRAGRADEVERQELRAWRFGFVALAASAVSGGALAMVGGVWTFAAGAVAYGAMLAVALRFHEPDHVASEAVPGLRGLAPLGRALRIPVLGWLFVLSVAMYAFSHVPFVFGQPFILQALEPLGLATEAPLVSGAVSALMMLLSVAASLWAAGLRRRLGLPVQLLLAFSMQVGLIAALSVSNSALAILFLLIRMVPNSLAQPFILARIQPLLPNDMRATYLSLQSLCGRLMLAGSLYFVSGSAPDRGAMAQGDIRTILGWYVLAGVVCLLGLALAARRIEVEG